MIAPAELPAEQLIPGDRMRRGIRVYEIARVGVTHDGPVQVTASRVTGAAGVAPCEDITLMIGEIVRCVPDTPASRERAA